MEKRDFFISYTQSDKDWAVWIANVLIAHGYTVYVQELDIRPGDNFIERMNDFLENSGNFIAVWSKAYSESRFCMTEFQAAFNQWNQTRMDCFLPVRVDNYPMKPLYAALVHVDLSDRGTVAEKNLVNAVRSTIVHSAPETNSGNVMNVNQSKTSGRLARRFIKYALVIVCFAALVLFANSVLRQIWEQSEPDNSFEELSADELFEMGRDYHYGTNGVEQDYTKAQEYYERAAAKDSASALNNLGVLYENGYGVAQDYAKAREYYEQATAEGNAYAPYNLGKLYEYGLGVEQNYAKALGYYQKAVDLGYEDATKTIAELRERLNG